MLVELMFVLLSGNSLQHMWVTVEATIHRADRFISHRISTENTHGIPIELVIYGIF
jgi:hypothetical protein